VPVNEIVFGQFNRSQNQGDYAKCDRNSFDMPTGPIKSGIGYLRNCMKASRACKTSASPPAVMAGGNRSLAASQLDRRPRARLARSPTAAQTPTLAAWTSRRHHA
jgi:hypothetical protein